jgi:hypothetical protein
MEPENFLQPEVAVTAAIVAAICSPRLRRFIRKSLVYGTAGALMAGDAVTSFAKNIGEGAKQAGSSMTQTTQEGIQQAQEIAAAAPTEIASSIHKKQRATVRKINRGHTGEQGGVTA